MGTCFSYAALEEEVRHEWQPAIDDEKEELVEWYADAEQIRLHTMYLGHNLFLCVVVRCQNKGMMMLLVCLSDVTDSKS